MSIIDQVKKIMASKGIYTDDRKSPSEDISNIWKITDKTELLIAINDRLNARSEYGEYMERLSSEEQVLYICMLLEAEVNNGGFDQFLYNSSGDHAHRAEECLRTIGAHKTADICHAAFSAYGMPIPQDRMKREKFLDKMESDEITGILNACDDQFYEYPDPLEDLCYQYITENKEKFA